MAVFCFTPWTAPVCLVGWAIIEACDSGGGDDPADASPFDTRSPDDTDEGVADTTPGDSGDARDSTSDPSDSADTAGGTFDTADIFIPDTDSEDVGPTDTPSSIDVAPETIGNPDHFAIVGELRLAAIMDPIRYGLYSLASANFFQVGEGDPIGWKGCRVVPFRDSKKGPPVENGRDGGAISIAGLLTEPPVQLVATKKEGDNYAYDPVVVDHLFFPTDVSLDVTSPGGSHFDRSWGFTLSPDQFPWDVTFIYPDEANHFTIHNAESPLRVEWEEGTYADWTYLELRLIGQNNFIEGSMIECRVEGDPSRVDIPSTDLLTLPFDPKEISKCNPADDLYKPDATGEECANFLHILVAAGRRTCITEKIGLDGTNLGQVCVTVLRGATTMIRLYN